MKDKPIILILGKRGQGKTTWIKRYLRNHNHKRVLIFDPLEEYDTGQFKSLSIGKMIDSVQSQKSFRIKISPYPLDRGFYYFCRVAQTLRNVVIIIEEIAAYCSPHSIPEHLELLIRQGRHHHQTLIATSQRPAGLPGLLTSQASQVVCFNLTRSPDIDYIADFFEEKAKEVKSLKTLEFLQWKKGKITKKRIFI